MEKILAMSFNSKYFQAGISLIASVHRYAFDTVDKIIIYDLGLTDREIAYLHRCEKVQVVKYPEIVETFFDGFLEPKQFAWKPFVIKDVGREGDLVFYLDAGIVILKDIQMIYDIIVEEDIFLVQDYNLNIDWTHSRAFELLNATEEEKVAKQLCAGIFGYKVGGKYQQMVDEALEYAQNKEILWGDRKNHRHDQSIYSVLAIRYKAPTKPLEIFGEWRGILHDKQILYVHRRKHKSKKGLRIKPIKKWFFNF